MDELYYSVLICGNQINTTGPHRTSLERDEASLVLYQAHCWTYQDNVFWLDVRQDGTVRSGDYEGRVGFDKY